MPRPLSPKNRFLLWSLAAAAPLAIAPLRVVVNPILDPDDRWRLTWTTAAVLQSALLVAIYVLLISTLKDAIKLKPVTSRVIIAFGTFLFLAFAAKEPFFAIAGLLASFTLLGIAAAARIRWSPWYLTLLLWHPIVALPFQPQIPANRTLHLGLIANALLLTSLLLAAIITRTTTQHPKLPAPSTGLFILLALATIAAPWIV